MPVQRGSAPVGVWFVLQSVPSNLAETIIADADAIVRSTVLLSCVHPVQTALSAPVTHYRISLKDLAVRFPAPYATINSRMVRATGSYRASSSSERHACFESVPLPTCALDSKYNA